MTSKRPSPKIQKILQQSFAVPYDVWLAVWIININAFGMGIADIFIEFFVYFDIFPEIPFRLDFFILTMISALMGYQTLKSLQREKFELTQDSAEVTLLVEIGLVITDVFFIINSTHYPGWWLRIPFIFLTILNVFLLIFVIRRLKIFEFKPYQRIKVYLNSIKSKSNRGSKKNSKSD